MSQAVIVLGIIGVLAIAGLSAIRIMRLSFRSLILGLSGAIIGLLMGALLSLPLGSLPTPFSNIFPIFVTILAVAVMIGAFVNQSEVITSLFPFMRRLSDGGDSISGSSGTSALVDTSVIIDARIADIAASGFAPTKLLVPRFVLAELQNIADSDDAMRRSRGRRGLESLNQLRANNDVTVEIVEDELASITEVDAKLVRLAKDRHIPVLTTDFNLNRVAQIEGVRVLNINELSNAIRPVVLPGEEMLVKVVQPGKERGQGVGYLSDGTMIVVENGDRMIGSEVTTEVTRVFQTVAGKMIFATPKTHDKDIVSTAKSSSSNGRVKPKRASSDHALPKQDRQFTESKK